MTSQTRRVLSIAGVSILLSLTATVSTFAQDLSSSPTSLNFGNVYIGKPSGSKALTITNISGGGITIVSIGFDCDGYGISAGIAPFSFGATQSITHYSIFLNPTAAQVYSCNFLMNMSDSTVVKVPITGTGIVSTGLASVNVSSLTFPTRRSEPPAPGKPLRSLTMARAKSL